MFASRPVLLVLFSPCLLPDLYCSPLLPVVCFQTCIVSPVLSLFASRPVFAIIEVDLYHVQSAKRAAIKQEVLEALGPSDPTIVVEEKGEPKLTIQHLLDLFKAYGEIVLVRYGTFSLLASSCTT